MKDMKPLKEKISITVDSEVLTQIRDKADYYERSLSQFINIILKDYLKNGDNRRDINDILSLK